MKICKDVSPHMFHLTLTYIKSSQATNLYGMYVLEEKACNFTCMTYIVLSSKFSHALAYFLFKVFNDQVNPWVTFSPIKKWKYGQTQEFHYTVRCGIEPDTSPWDWIGVFKVR